MNLIAQPCCFLELEVSGVLMHAFFEASQLPRRLFRGQRAIVRHRLGSPTPAVASGLRPGALENIPDLLANGPGDDPVGLVVGFLASAPTVYLPTCLVLRSCSHF